VISDWIDAMSSPNSLSLELYTAAARAAGMGDCLDRLPNIA
jgi:hypothetical protein